MNDNQSDGAPSSSEPAGEQGNVQPVDAGLTPTSPVAGVVANAAIESPTSTSTESPGSDTTVTTDTTSGTELGNVAGAAVDGAPEAGVAVVAGGDAGNVAGQPEDFADTATSASTAQGEVSVLLETAGATFADLLDVFETRQYEDGSILKTTGTLPETSVVSYPEPQEPAADTPHGLLNAIEAFFTSALRNSRTDGHRLIAQLRAQLPE